MGMPLGGAVGTRLGEICPVLKVTGLRLTRAPLFPLPVPLIFNRYLVWGLTLICSRAQELRVNKQEPGCNAFGEIRRSLNRSSGMI